jgi:hypothetical protein
MSDHVPAKAKRPRRHWFFWWKIDADELEEQVIGYRTLGPLKSARGISVICLLISIVITLVFVALKMTPISGIGDALLMAVLSVFIYFGHRWALIVAMLLWTVEKLLVLIGGFSGATPNGGLAVVQVIWWCVYMHAFYLAFRVEQRRRNLTKG